MAISNHGGCLINLVNVLRQRQIRMRPQFAHKNTTTSCPTCQAWSVSTGNGRPSCSSKYVAWEKTRSAVSARGILNE